MEDEIISENLGAEEEESAEMLGEDDDCEDTVKAEQEQKENSSGVVADSEDAVKTEEQKTNYVPPSRFAPHNIPDWNYVEMRERWMWNLRIYPLHQDDCKNCILDSATKIAQESWYYAPKMENGLGQAELCMLCTNKMTSVMSRIITMPFFYRYITIELTRRKDEDGDKKDGDKKEGDATETHGNYKTVMETATIVYDSTKCDQVRGTDMSRGPLKKRRIWVRYLSENTTPEILRVLFPLSQSAEVVPQDSLCVGLVESRSRGDVQIFTKSYITLVINGKLIWSLHDKKRGESETETHSRLEQTVTPLEGREEAPIEVAERPERKKDKRIPRSLKRTLNHQQHTIDRRRIGNGNPGRQEPPPKRRRSSGNRRDGRRRRGGRYGDGGDSDYAYARAHSGFGAYFHPEDMATEMMLMQAELNHTLQSQLMMMSPSAGGGGGYYSGAGDVHRLGYGGGGRQHFGGGW